MTNENGSLGMLGISRRIFAGQAMLAAACGTAGWLRFGGSPSVSAGWNSPFDVANPETPQQALELLYEGNRRFASGAPRDSRRDMERVREVASSQRPFAAFLGCADSRVPIEIIFNQGFGDLFVTRIAGNVASSENVGSLEFGTEMLGAKVLYVLGHTQCGAVTAAVRGTDVPGQISGLFQHIRPAVKSAKGDVDAAIAANVRHQAVILAESSPVISRRIQRGELIVAGGIYELASGRVSAVDVQL